MAVKHGGRGRGHSSRMTIIGDWVGGGEPSPGGPPINGVPPVITGTLRVGETLSIDNGVWYNEPTSFDHGWFRANDTSGTGLLYLAAGPTYTLVAADEGKYIVADTRAYNEYAPEGVSEFAEYVGPIEATAEDNLTPLTLSTTEVTEDFAATVNILGATNGSTITADQLPAGMTLDSGARSIAGTPTTPGTTEIELTETLAGKTNSPLVSNVSITVSEGSEPASLATAIASATSINAQFMLYVDSDIDPGNERDDEGALALILASQDHFDILGMSASAPDSHVLGYTALTTAYEADRAKVAAHTPYPERFKTKAQLDALTVQGLKVDQPAAGYSVFGSSTYTLAHAAAQNLITAAQDARIDPNSEDPRKKLWVFVQGGFTTIAQAAYEAVQLGGLPDFFKRIRLLVQPNHNSLVTVNAWTYLFSNHWPAAETPGLFGDMHMLCGYNQWPAFNRNNGTTDSTFWANIIAKGAMGAALEYERSISQHTETYYRAADAGAWLWLMSAKMRGTFAPTDTDNWCGVYRTYPGVVPWPSRTIGNDTNPEGVTYSETIWAPELTVNNRTTAPFIAVDVENDWYPVVDKVWDRYASGNAITSDPIGQTGTRKTIFSLALPASGSTNTDFDVTISWLGEAVASDIVLTLSDSSTVTITSSDTSPKVVQRQVSEIGTYALSITSLTGNGYIVGGSDTIALTAAGGGMANLAALFLSGDQGMVWNLNDLSTVFQDVAGTTPVTAAGQVVGKILDLSGLNNHWTAAADNTTRPTYQVDGDGAGYLDCDGSNDVLFAVTPFVKSDGVYTSCMGVLAPSNGTARNALSASSTGSTTPWVFPTRSSSGTSNAQQRHDASGLNATTGIASIYDGSTKRVITSQASADNDWLRQRARDQGTTWDTTTGITNFGTSTLTRAGLGAHVQATPSGYWLGRIYSGFAISRELSDADLATVEQAIIDNLAGVVPEPEPEPETDEINAPMLFLTSPTTTYPPEIVADFDATVFPGDSFRLQAQEAGGDWSVLLVDSTTVLADVDDLDVGLSAITAEDGEVEIRGWVVRGSTESPFSNIIETGVPYVA